MPGHNVGPFDLFEGEDSLESNSGEDLVLRIELTDSTLAATESARSTWCTWETALTKSARTGLTAATSASATAAWANLSKNVRQAAWGNRLVVITLTAATRATEAWRWSTSTRSTNSWAASARTGRSRCAA